MVDIHMLIIYAAPALHYGAYCNYQIHMKSDLEHAKKCQEWKAKKASSRDEIQQNGG